MSDPSVTAKFPIFAHIRREKKYARPGALDSGCGENPRLVLITVVVDLVPPRGFIRALEKRENPHTKWADRC
jgi:hypothetical protein